MSGISEREGAPTFEQQYQMLEYLDRKRMTGSEREFSTRLAQEGGEDGLNRWVDAIGWDHALVRPASGEYLNASRIPPMASTKRGQQAYVASQAPLPWTFPTFVDAVVADRSKLLVNLTKSVEDGIVKAADYWPQSGKTLRTDGWEVTLLGVSRPVCPGWELTQRVLRFTPAQGEAYDLTQLHVTSWPDFGALGVEPYERLLHLIKSLHASLLAPGEQAHPPPIWMHCSAGLGRTGTVIAGLLALDTVTGGMSRDDARRQAPEAALSLITYLRTRRPRMVQGVAQAQMVVQLIERLMAAPTSPA